MPTRKQIEANRRNSQLSTGPKTDEGKAASSQNALKHGLHAEDFLLHYEDFDGFDLFRNTLMHDQQPNTAQEIILIDQILQSYFLSRRACTFMSEAFDVASRDGTPLSQSYPVFMRIKTQNDRIVFRAFEELHRIKQARNSAPSVHKTEGLEENGFVLPDIPPTPAACRNLPPNPFTGNHTPQEPRRI